MQIAYLNRAENVLSFLSKFNEHQRANKPKFT